ncbi:MAG: hypothetical protein ACYC8T_02700 [Myxococcaceae bacterium]
MLVKVNPVEYLADVLPRLATRRIRLCDMPALLPAAWKVARSGATVASASDLASVA